MKTLIALCVLLGALAPAAAQFPSLQDLKKLNELRPAPTPAGAEPAAAPAPAGPVVQKTSPSRGSGQTNAAIIGPDGKKTFKRHDDLPPAAAPAVGMMPECEKTKTLLGLCPKGSRPYGSEPQAAAAPIPVGYPSGPNGIRPGETTAQCEARVAATRVKIRKGGCRRTQALDTGY